MNNSSSMSSVQLQALAVLRTGTYLLTHWAVGLAGPKWYPNLWHKIISAPAMLVLALERMRVSPCRWGWGEGVLVGWLYVTCPHKHRYAGLLMWTKLTAFERPWVHISAWNLGEGQRSGSFHSLAASWCSGEDTSLLLPPGTELTIPRSSTA
jgi:hypothetical protein